MTPENNVAGAASFPLASASPATTGSIVEFFDPAGAECNAVVRAFENTAGRGLAGFITSLDFDHADSTWDIRIGNKAPIFTKITMQFAPVHDLPIGLDHEGMLKSTPYGVGRLANAVAGGGDPHGGFGNGPHAVGSDKPHYAQKLKELKKKEKALSRQADRKLERN